LKRSTPSESYLRRELCAAGRTLREHGFLPAAAGNLSARLADGRILTTPSGVPKGLLTPRDLMLLEADGFPARNRTHGARKHHSAQQPSSELAMHLRIYSLRPDVRAICHAHPPTATGFATAGRALDCAVLGETAILLGAVPVAPYGAPGTDDLPNSIAPFVSRANAVLLANHGVVAYGETIRTAVARMELVEHLARVMLVAELAGGAKLLTRAQIAALVASRSRYGLPPLPAGAIPWLTAEDRTGKR
jgi:L-fuculose-phosphate aldolase